MVYKLCIFYCTPDLIYVFVNLPCSSLFVLLNFTLFKKLKTKCTCRTRTQGKLHCAPQSQVPAPKVQHMIKTNFSPSAVVQPRQTYRAETSLGSGAKDPPTTAVDMHAPPILVENYCSTKNNCPFVLECV